MWAIEDTGSETTTSSESGGRKAGVRAVPISDQRKRPVLLGQGLGKQWCGPWQYDADSEDTPARVIRWSARDRLVVLLRTPEDRRHLRIGRRLDIPGRTRRYKCVAVSAALRYQTVCLHYFEVLNLLQTWYAPVTSISFSRHEAGVRTFGGWLTRMSCHYSLRVLMSMLPVQSRRRTHTPTPSSAAPLLIPRPWFASKLMAKQLIKNPENLRAQAQRITHSAPRE
ncbi:hypothetical protein FA95DRAFT_662754 [Auriscalpium vulgare]|uniref:Uncharacterized protein n=1 Tax=Auriscalpium vulgare TaxID=40419 RepID=A0ACB8S2I1_9AGAM|nr:hypothetical protein FA95DRAFT_662754 [Auriscalpium vulgare]